MNYFCCNDTRRNAVKLYPTLNGIDYLEVLDNASDPYNERQTTLFIHFIKPLIPGTLEPTNFQVEGGERIRHIRVLSVALEPEEFFPLSPPDDSSHVLSVKVSEAGDFSMYTLRLVSDGMDKAPPANFDPVLSSIDFSFKVACPADFDCRPVHNCAPAFAITPEINYLAKDYSSFRALMLDRMALLLPGWTERNPADMGIALVELLAYVGDYLSYRQDAIATEAYLHTARSRVSVRRHARLVDYFMHDGCNARAWLHIQVGPNVNGLLLEKGKGADATRIITKVNGLPPALRLDSADYEKALYNGVKVFELMHDVTLYTAHNEMNFYTWGGKECCLPKGTIQATLAGAFPGLKPGDVLILSEVLGAETGVAADADPSRRHAIRLTDVTISQDLLYDQIPASSAVDPSAETDTIQVTEIKWDKADALPFPLCISNRQGIENISIAYGNIVLTDHGLTVTDGEESSLQPAVVPLINQVYATNGNSATACCEPKTPVSIAPRFRPRLMTGPLTFAAPFTAALQQSASDYMKWSMRTPMPVIRLKEAGTEGDIKGNPEWSPKRDLLNSASNKKEFVVEMESDGTAYIRFGDDVHGSRPPSSIMFVANYRLGNGVSGNIGAGSLAHIITNDAGIIANMSKDAAVWNPLPAHGGMQAESMEEVKQYAPDAFRTQKRAVTAADYEVMARQCNPDVQRAAATFRWTGSWKTVFLSVDRLQGLGIDTDFEKTLRNCMEKYRMAGFDLEVDAPINVSLEIEMNICVNQRFFASDVKKALLEQFSNRMLPGGRMGIFHPDNFSFGQAVYLSPLYAAAQSVQGVDSVKIIKFQRQGKNNDQALLTGKLTLERREIARLDNDRNFPERGVLRLNMKGGRS